MDGIDFVGNIERYVTGTFSKIEKESLNIDLMVNEDNTRLMLAIARLKL